MAYASQSWTKNLLEKVLRKIKNEGTLNNEYSEEETVVGNVDGKPLYCKKIILNLPKGAYSSQLVFDGEAQNIKEILSHTFNLHNQWTSSTSYRFVITKYTNKGNLYASVGSSHPELTLDGYIKYTKTTD